MPAVVINSTYPIRGVGHSGTDSGGLYLLSHTGLDDDLRCLKDESADIFLELLLVLCHCISLSTFVVWKGKRGVVGERLSLARKGQRIYAGYVVN